MICSDTKRFYQPGDTLIYSQMFKEEVEIIKKNDYINYQKQTRRQN